MDAGRRCALPGCYVVIAAPADGAPQRKYCTPAHRAVARQLRREATNRSAAAPPLILQELPEPPLAAGVGAGPVRRRRTFSDVAGRRARAMAVLGSAGLLVTGGTLAFSGSPTGDSPSAAPWLAPDPEAEQSWASEANVTLASLDRQLQEVEQVERSWNALPPQERGRQTPPDVEALAQRKALLEQQRARLADELSTYQSLRVAKQQLIDTERHVAGLDKALAHSRQDRRRGNAAPPDDDTTAALRERRSAGDKLRQEQREKVDELTERVRDAMSTPLPGGDQATRSITSRVRDLVENPSARHSGSRDDRGPLGSDAASTPGPTPKPRPPHANLPVQPHRPDVLAAPANPGAELRESITSPREGVGERAPGGPLGGLTGHHPGGLLGGGAPGGLTGHRPGSTNTATSGPISRVAPGRSPRTDSSPPATDLVGDGPAAHGPAADAPALGADEPRSPLPRLTPRRSRTPSPPPGTSKADPDLGLGDPGGRSAASGHRSAADDVIDALPFGAGVKQMARSAVADEIKTRQRKGRLSGGQPSASSSSTATRRMGPKYSSADNAGALEEKGSSARAMDDLSSLSRSYASKYSSKWSSGGKSSSKASDSSSSDWLKAYSSKSFGSSKSGSSKSDWFKSDWFKSDLFKSGSSGSGRSGGSGGSGGGKKSSDGDSFERALSRYSSGGSGKKSGSSDHYRSSGKSSGGKSSDGKSSGKSDGGHFASKMAKSFKF